MDTDTTPVATVTGLYRGTFSGLEPLTQDEVRRNPVFYELDLQPGNEGADLIIDIIYDNLSPLHLQDLERDTDIPRGVRFWQDWFDIPHYREMRDIDGRRVYPRSPGTHTVRIRTAKRKLGQVRDFSPANGGYMSPVFEITIAAEVNDGRE